MRDAALIAYVLSRPWALYKPYMAKMIEVLRRHADGVRLSEEEIRAAIGKPPEEGKVYTTMRGGSVAVIPVTGYIAKRASQVQGISAPRGTSTEQIQRAVEVALRDPEIQRLVLAVDSPGGSVDGVADLADFIRASRAQKPITAYADGLMASAAYWIGSAADRIVASQDAEIGSIGVYALLESWTEANAKMGLSVEMIRAGQFKGEGHPDLPITDATRQVTQDVVDAYYAMFVNAVAANRGIKREEALALADGRTWVGATAVKQGLADSIGMLNDAAAPFGKDAAGAAAGLSGGASVQAPANADVAQPPSAVREPQPVNPEAGAEARPVRPILSLPAAAERARATRNRKTGITREELRATASASTRPEGVTHMDVKPTQQPTQADLRLAEATLEDLLAVQPQLVKRIKQEALADEKARQDGIAALLKESQLPDAVRGQVAVQIAGLPVANAKTIIESVCAVEAAFKVAELQGLDAQDLVCLRSDVEGLPQLSAVNHIRRVVDAKKGAQARLVKDADKAVQGQDPEETPEQKAEKERQAQLAAAVTQAREAFTKVKVAGADLKQFVVGALEDAKLAATPEQLKAAAPDLFKS
jgi:signal peptide peptidase SppA